MCLGLRPHLLWVKGAAIKGVHSAVHANSAELVHFYVGPIKGEAADATAQLARPPLGPGGEVKQPDSAIAVAGEQLAGTSIHTIAKVDCPALLCVTSGNKHQTGQQEWLGSLMTPAARNPFLTRQFLRRKIWFVVKGKADEGYDAHESVPYSGFYLWIYTMGRHKKRLYLTPIQRQAQR